MPEGIRGSYAHLVRFFLEVRATKSNRISAFSLPDFRSLLVRPRNAARCSQTWSKGTLARHLPF